MLNVNDFFLEMAANKLKPDKIDDILFVNSSRYSLGSHYGYKTSYLGQELSPIEEKFLICEYCKGFARQACLKNGNISCWGCIRNTNNAQPVDQSRQSITKLLIKCPLLRECEWNGMMSEAETHMKECPTLRLLCPLECGVVFQRCEMANHVEQECPLHKVKCKFCEKTFRFNEVTDHEEICIYQPIKCDCGNDFPRAKLAMHIETECPFGKVECPYAKYSCKIGNMHRKDLLAHKQELYIEHQDMLEEENYRLKMQIDSLNTKMMFKREMDHVKLRISDPLSSETEIEGPIINSGGSRFKSFVTTGETLSIGICKAWTISKDPNTTHFHLFLSLESNELDFYHDKTSVLNNDVGRIITILFSMSKEVYSKFILADTLYVKMYFE